MTTRVIRIELDGSGVARGSKNINQSLEKVDRRAKGVTSTFGNLKKIAAVAFTAATIRGIVRTADEYTRLQSRLRLVTDNQMQLNQTYRDLTSIAQATRTGLTATVNLYSDLARSTQDLNLAQSDLLEFTDLIQKSFVVSGSSSEAAGRAVVQLGQAFAEGTFRAQEFNSILDGSPELLRAVADGLGLTFGELRRQVIDGELSTQLFLKGLREGGGQLVEQFNNITPTVDQAFTVLKNSVLNFIGTVDESSGATNSLATAILSFGEALSDPQIAEGIGVILGGLVSIIELAVRAIGVFGQLAKSIFDVFNDTNGIEETTATIEKLESRLALVNDRIERTNAGKDSALQQQADKLNTILDEQRAKLEALTAAAKELNDETGAGGTGEGQGIDLSGAGGGGGNKDGQSAFDSAVRGLREELDLVGEITEVQKTRFEIENGRYKEFTDAQKEKVLALAAEVDTLRSITDAIDAVFIEEQRLDEFRRSAKETRAQQIRDIKRAEVESLEQLEEKISLTEDFGAVFNSAFEEAIVNGDDLGGVFESLIDDILQLTTRVLILEPLLNSIFGKTGSGGGGGGLLGSLFGGGGDNIFGSLGSIFGKNGGGAAGLSNAGPVQLLADGGNASAGSFAIVGEREPELVQFGAQARVTPFSRMGGGSSTTNVIINNNGDGTARTQRKPNASGGEDIEVFIDRNVGRSLSDGEGRDTLRNDFGVKPTPQLVG